MLCQKFIQIFSGKPLGHLPSPEDGPLTPTGQSLASEMLPLELSLRAAPHFLEVSKHRGTFAVLLRYTAHGSNANE